MVAYLRRQVVYIVGHVSVSAAYLLHHHICAGLGKTVTGWDNKGAAEELTEERVVWLLESLGLHVEAGHHELDERDESLERVLSE